jgi:hypothetical protein
MVPTKVEIAQGLAFLMAPTLGRYTQPELFLSVARSKVLPVETPSILQLGTILFSAGSHRGVGERAVVSAGFDGIAALLSAAISRKSASGFPQSTPWATEA